MKIDDKRHFEEYKERMLKHQKKTSVFVNGTKAGFKPSQRRGPDGRWIAAGGENSEEEEKKKWEKMRKLEDHIRDQEYETSGIFDENGELIFTKDGDENHVSFTDYEIEAMKGMNITHNHPFPGSGSLSTADLASGMYMELGSIKSVARNGDWTKAVFNHDYIRELRNKISEIHNIPFDDVNIGGIIHEISATQQRMFEANNHFGLALAQLSQDPQDIYELNNRFGKELMQAFQLGLKEHESNWAPMEIDKLWTITSGTDEI